MDESSLKRKEQLDYSGIDKRARKDEERDEEFDREQFGDLEAAALQEGVDVSEQLALVESAGQATALSEPEQLQRIHRLKVAVDTNDDLRTRHADEPLKFMQSEQNLDECVKTLLDVGTEPHLFSVVVDNGLETLLGLLHHENCDLGLSVIDLFSQMIDEEGLQTIVHDSACIDALQEPNLESLSVLRKHTGGSWSLVWALDKLDAFPLLIRFACRLNEFYPSHAHAVEQVLGLFQSLCEQVPNVCTLLLKTTPLGCYLLVRANYVVSCLPANTTLPMDSTKNITSLTLEQSRATHSSCSSNRLTAIELLVSIVETQCLTVPIDSLPVHAQALFPTDPKVPSVLNVGSGVLVLLDIVNQFKKLKSIEDQETEELVYNTYLLLRMLLAPQYPEYRTVRNLFTTLEGPQLLLSILPRQNYALLPCLQLLDVFCEHNPEAAALLVQTGVLKILFALLKYYNAKSNSTASQILDKLTSVLYWLLRGTQDTDLLRVLAKFAESQCEKTDLLITTLQHTLAHLEKSETAFRISEQLPPIVDPQVGYGEIDTLSSSSREDPDERYVRRLSAGLFGLQRTCLCLAYLRVLDPACIGQHIRSCVTQGKLSLVLVSNVLREYLTYIDDEENRDILTKIQDAFEDQNVVGQE